MRMLCPPSAWLASIVLAFSVVLSPVAIARTSDYDYVESRAVVARFYDWYCLQPATPSCGELEAVRALFVERLHDDLCREPAVTGDAGPQQTPSSVDPFSGGPKATSFRLRSSFVVDDVAIVNVALRSGELTLYVTVQLAFSPNGWVMSDIRYRRAGTVVRRPQPARPAPPN